MIRRIEIDFALPVELLDAEMRTLYEMADKIAHRHQPEGMVHWAFGCGDKPRLSKADAAFLGKEAEADAPESGEPTFDDSIFYIETAAREKYDTD